MLILRYAGHVLKVQPNSDISILTNGEVIITPLEERVLEFLSKKEEAIADLLGEEVIRLTPKKRLGKPIDPNSALQRVTKEVTKYMARHETCAKADLRAHVFSVLQDINPILVDNYLMQVKGIKRDQGVWSRRPID